MIITITPVSFFILRIYGLPWITIPFFSISPLILLGIYYGFLSTLPLGPAQFLCIRAFLLESEGKESEALGTTAKNEVVIAAVCGLALSQLLFFLSIYSAPLYIFCVKPYMLSIAVVLYMIWYYRRLYLSDIMQFSTNYKIYYGSLFSQRITAVFVDSFFFQSINPVLLPSPVLTRLMNLFLFRYSQVFTFILGGMIGWLGGQITFILLSSLLLLRLERDAPIVYVGLKILVHRIWPRIVFAFCLVYLGRVPVVSLTTTRMKKANIQLLSDSTEQKDWTSVLLDNYTWFRPLRFICNEKDFIKNQQEQEIEGKSNVEQNSTPQFSNKKKIFSIPI